MKKNLENVIKKISIFFKLFFQNMFLFFLLELGKKLDTHVDVKFCQLSISGVFKAIAVHVLLERPDAGE